LFVADPHSRRTKRSSSISTRYPLAPSRSSTPWSVAAAASLAPARPVKPARSRAALGGGSTRKRRRRGSNRCKPNWRALAVDPLVRDTMARIAIARRRSPAMRTRRVHIGLGETWAEEWDRATPSVPRREEEKKERSNSMLRCRVVEANAYSRSGLMIHVQCSSCRPLVRM
jgi:hypothetical protein